MVGDGVDDAPRSHSRRRDCHRLGTDVAMESADIVLMRSDVMDVAAAVEL